MQIITRNRLNTLLKMIDSKQPQQLKKKAKTTKYVLSLDNNKPEMFEV